MNNYIREFQGRILKKKVKIAVVGLGYVGLPLAIEFAKKGLVVLGIEIDKDRLNHIKKKESYIIDVPTKDLRQALSSRRFCASGKFDSLKEMDVVIVCVPTPLKRKYHPNMSYIINSVKSISGNLKRGALVILESTTYPGTTEEVILPLLEKPRFRHNRDFFLCFSPERIDPGNKNYPVHKIPKIVGGISPEAAALGKAVYQNIIDKVVVVSSARTAEAAKLLENTFRLINIGLIDELAMMAHKMKIDIWEVISAASTKPFGFMPFYPGPGVGGHCIPKDPLYLYWKARRFGFSSRFIKLASDIINYMPEYVAARIEEASGKSAAKTRVLVVGVTYKKDIKDLRKSPSIDLIDILKRKGSRVSYTDPLIPYLKINSIDLRSVELTKSVVGKFDCVVIATDHSSIDYGLILRNAKMILDTRNVYKNKKDKRIIKL
ncbi:MAG: nucleotide sugar dehydrogenase [Candidatus Omnitrophica bacterium]|nr:nucleotide sugar dehydrogenase [Candidatus Omnitrophota bacterium]